jgi:hypothetical protein
MKVIQQLIAYFEERGGLTRSQIEQLIERGYWAQYTPGELRDLESRVGQTFLFHVEGATIGPLWGTDVYTTDSDLGTACVHAGVLGPGEEGAVRVTMVKPPRAFQGSTRHGVTSSDWTTGWSGAYRVEAPRS